MCLRKEWQRKTETVKIKEKRKWQTRPGHFPVCRAMQLLKYFINTTCIVGVGVTQQARYPNVYSVVITTNSSMYS